MSLSDRERAGAFGVFFWTVSAVVQSGRTAVRGDEHPRLELQHH
ncbi:hypothetical protein [Halorussus salinus]|nr:hypothetical protein [Halorussus salinus]